MTSEYGEKLRVDTGTGHEEGYLSRKHEMEGPELKACRRSWEKVYLVVHGPFLSCYKDQKHAAKDPNSCIHHESSLDLIGAECELPTDYKKRNNVFRLRLASGGEYLFMANDMAEMERWMNIINWASSKGEKPPAYLPATREEPNYS